MLQNLPELIICVEGGVITHVATANDYLKYRIIDFDELKVGARHVFDRYADETLIEIEEHTLHCMEV